MPWASDRQPGSQAARPTKEIALCPEQKGEMKVEVWIVRVWSEYR